MDETCAVLLPTLAGRTFGSFLDLTCGDTSVRAQTAMIGWLNFAVVAVIILCLMTLLCMRPRDAAAWLAEPQGQSHPRELTGPGQYRPFDEIQLPPLHESAVASARSPVASYGTAAGVHVSAASQRESISGLPRVVATPIDARSPTAAVSGESVPIRHADSAAAAYEGRASRALSSMAPRVDQKADLPPPPPYSSG